MTTLSPPDWTHCGHDSSASNPVGCRGITIPGSAKCLLHAEPAERTAYIASLSPGADLDLRGTTITPDFLTDILTHLTDPATGHPRIGDASFRSATFSGDASFRSATFTRNVWFRSATFSGEASFRSVTFTGDAWFQSVTFTRSARFQSATLASNASFRSATFSGEASFRSATFTRNALFDSATFTSNARFQSATFTRSASFQSVTFASDASFRSATFSGNASFGSAAFSGNASFQSTTFSGNAWFPSATFTSNASFRSASFERASTLGPLACGARVDLSAATFGAPITIEVAATLLTCRRTRWLETAQVWLRYAEVNLSDAVFDHPLTLATRRRPFAQPNGADLDEGALAGTDPLAQVTSLQGVDAADLVLTDVDLSRCLFSGTVHLDHVRLEGQYRLAAAPSGLHRRGVWPVRWTPRRALAEEHHWRATRQVGADGWIPAPSGQEVLVPAALAPVYRQLRKSFEDGKHEPGAADFYYGEMEMRRRADDIPSGERRLLTLYWALSGYGLRASRALTWLLAAMTLTVLVMMLWGLPEPTLPPAAPALSPAGISSSAPPSPTRPTPPDHSPVG